jgi:hypothetical protein
MTNEIPSIWVDVNGNDQAKVTLAGFYREWKDQDDQRQDWTIINNQIHLASKSSKTLILGGDCNLDLNRSDDPTYNPLMRQFLRDLEAISLTLNLNRTSFSNTYCRVVEGINRQSGLDQVMYSNTIKHADA